MNAIRFTGPWPVGRALFIHFACAALLTTAAGSVRAGDSEQRFQQAWDHAASLQDAQDHHAAAEAYRDIVTEFPEAQRARLRVAINLERAGAGAESLQAYREAIEADVDSSWGATGLYYMARAALGQGADSGFHWAHSTALARHPDSAWTTRVEALDAQRRGNAAEASLLEAALQNEIEATEHLNEALSLASADQLDDALLMLRQGLAEYSQQRVKWQLKEAEGHVLIRQERWADARSAFAEVLAGLARDYPQSRVVTVSLKRLGGIAHATGQKEEALGYFQQLLETTGSASAAEHAMLQSCGLLMEQLIDRGHDAFDAEENKPLEELLLATRDEREYTDYTRARAGLMLIELYLWQGGRHDELASASTIFTDSETGFAGNDALKHELASAYVTMAQSFTMQRRYDDVLILADKVLEMYPEEKQLWPTMQHLEVIRYFKYGALRYLGKNAEAAVVLDEFRGRFPDSPFVQGIDAKEGAANGSIYDQRAARYQSEIQEIRLQERIEIK